MLLNKCRNVCKNNGQVLQESSRQLNWVCTSFGVLLPVFVLATACAHPWSKPIGTAKPFQASAETTCQHTVPTQWHSKHHVCSWRPAWCSEFLFNPICQIHTLVYRGPRLQISIWFNCNLYHISYIYISYVDGASPSWDWNTLYSVKCRSYAHNRVTACRRELSCRGTGKDSTL